MTYRVRNFVLAIALAVIAALFVGFYVANYKRTVQHSEGHVPVFVAAKDIPAGTSGADVVSGGYLREEQVLRRTVVPGAISKPEQLQKLVATQSTFAGEQVTLARFSSLAVRGVRAELRGTKRAVFIAGDANQTLAGLLRAGDHVDVVVNMTVPESGHHVDRIILRNLLVLKAPPDPDSESKLGPASAFPVMLRVTDTQVQKLYYAYHNTDWGLELRPVVKASDSPEAVEDVDTVVRDGLKPAQVEEAWNEGRAR